MGNEEKLKQIYKQEKNNYISNYEYYDDSIFFGSGKHKKDIEKGKKRWQEKYPEGFYSWITDEKKEMVKFKEYQIVHHKLDNRKIMITEFNWFSNRIECKYSIKDGYKWCPFRPQELTQELK